jgi:hypothetical protein
MNDIMWGLTSKNAKKNMGVALWGRSKSTSTMFYHPTCICVVLSSDQQCILQLPGSRNMRPVKSKMFVSLDFSHT